LQEKKIPIIRKGMLRINIITENLLYMLRRLFIISSMPKTCQIAFIKFILKEISHLEDMKNFYRNQNLKMVGFENR